jgi:hypothetical protein
MRWFAVIATWFVLFLGLTTSAAFLPTAAALIAAAMAREPASGPVT